MIDLADRLKAATGDPLNYDGPKQPAVYRLQTRKASDIEAREIKWIWKWWLPAGMIGLFAGYGGSGKSMIALSIIAACSAGGLLPDGQRAPLLNSLIFAAEDSPEHTIIPRLAAMGADLERIHIVDGIARNDDDPGWVQLRDHAAVIEQAVIEHHIGLVIIDPVSSYIGDANSDKESDVRSGITPLIQMAERTGAAVLMIRHVSKAGDGTRAASRILGSTAWHDIPRVAWMLADAPDDHQPEPREDGTRDTRRVLGVVKCNLAAKPPARWCIQQVNGPLRWLPDPSPVTVDECFFAQPDRVSKGHAADEWATDYLKGGAKSSTQLFADAKGKFSEKTLRASLRRIGAKSLQLPGKAHGGWFWRLPPAEGSLAHGDAPDSNKESDDSLLHRSLAHDGQVTQETATSGHLVDSPAGSPDAADVGQVVSLGHLPIVSTRESDPSDQVTDSLQHLDAVNRADVEEIVTEMVAGGPVVVAEYRSRIAALPDSDRRLVELALRLAEMAAA